MPIYHINPESGLPGRCRAIPGNCPFASEIEHHPSAEAARTAYERDMAHAILPSASAIDILRSMELKEMDASLLARTLQHEAVAAHISAEDIASAIDLATILHSKQMRANRAGFPKTPYIEHPLRNALRLIRLGVKDRDVIIATILHDTVEDGSELFIKKFMKEKPGSEVQNRAKLSTYIDARYGARTNRLVQAVTNAPAGPETKSLTRAEKAIIYKDHVEENIKDDGAAYLIKIADFIDNAGSLHHTDTEGSEAGTMRRAQKYYPVINVFRKYLSNTDGLISKQSQDELKRQLDRTDHNISNILEKYKAIA